MNRTSRQWRPSLVRAWEAIELKSCLFLLRLTLQPFLNFPTPSSSGLGEGGEVGEVASDEYCQCGPDRRERYNMKSSMSTLSCPTPAPGPEPCPSRASVRSSRFVICLARWSAWARVVSSSLFLHPKFFVGSNYFLSSRWLNPRLTLSHNVSIPHCRTGHRGW